MEEMLARSNLSFYEIIKQDAGSEEGSLSENELKIEKEEKAERSVKEKDALDYYMKEVSKFPVLSREEEVKLAAKIKRGGKIGREARKKFIECNLRLVFSIAKRFIGQGFPLSDLIQEGNIGLMAAVDKFNRKLGYRFSTYAFWWIRQAMQKAIFENGQIVKMPPYIHEKMHIVIKAERQLLSEKGSATISEIAKKTKLSKEKVTLIQRLRKIKKSISLNGKVSFSGEESEDELIDFLTKEEARERLGQYCAMEPPGEREDLRKNIEAALNLLKPTSAEVLCLRTGYDRINKEGYDGKTNKEVGRRFKKIGGNKSKVTRQRIDQIYWKAIKKIKNSKEGKILEELYFSSS